jgi:Tat protein secretion system quality control protein TatD with DNase activity
MSYHTNDDIGIVIVDTHGHAQLDRDRDETYHLSSQQPKKKILVKSLACSVEPDDFDITLKYAATSDFILPALGVHPWYIPNLTSYDNNNTVTDNDIDNDNDNDNDTDIDGSFDVDVDIDIDWLLPLEELLIKHPKCLVGEIGLCKIAKWVRKHPKGKSFAMSIQKRIFRKQLLLAAKLRRPVSVHCVNCHGIFVDTIKEITNENHGDDDDDNNSDLRRLLPPVIGMHSFTGTAHHVKELLELERQIVSPSSSKIPRKRNKTKMKKNKEQQQQQDAADDGDNNNDKEKEDPSSSSSSHNKPIFYFGFSHSVNYAMCT